MTIAVPNESEYAPAFARYIARVASIEDPMRELTSQRAAVVARPGARPLEQARRVGRLDEPAGVDDAAASVYEDNVLKVHYQGACGSCPSSLSATLTGIEGLVQSVAPELQVVPV